VAEVENAAGAGEPATGDAARLRSLLEIAKVVGAVGRFDDLVELTAEEARRALDAASLSISRWDRESGTLRTLVNVGLLGPGEVRFPTDEVYSVSQWPHAMRLVDDRQGNVAVADDADGDNEQARLLVGLGKDSSIATPIVVEARVWGELYATRTASQSRFTTAELDFANAVATQVAAGVVQADHFARIERLAFQDPLTGLANRRAVDERLETAMTELAESGTPVSLVLADINRLKQINDSFGHDAGDRLIVSVGDAVSRASGLAPGSLAARIGGDEFCIVVSGAPGPVAVEVARELCRLVDQQPMSTGVSCGVASTDTLTAPVNSPARLFRLADAAQYRAKRSGSRTPVVAGQVVQDPRSEPPVRRARRGRLAVDGAATLESGIEILDGLVDSGPQARVEAIADHLLLMVDAAAWWVSYVAPGSRYLVGISNSVHRFGEVLDEFGVAQGLPGATFDLDEFPSSDAAVQRAAAFRVELGAGDNDTAEEAVLVTAGYSGLLAAGATGASGGWLVEIYTDSISLPVGGFEPVLRSLVSLAVTGAAGHPGPTVVPAPPIRARPAVPADGAGRPLGSPGPVP
jgi:diguanylate cyclase (GGDEF)-like protein